MCCAQADDLNFYYYLTNVCHGLEVINDAYDVNINIDVSCVMVLASVLCTSILATPCSGGPNTVGGERMSSESSERSYRGVQTVTVAYTHNSVLRHHRLIDIAYIYIYICVHTQRAPHFTLPCHASA